MNADKCRVAWRAPATVVITLYVGIVDIKKVYDYKGGKDWE